MDHTSNNTSGRKHSNAGKVVIIVLSVVALLALLATLYYFFIYNDSSGEYSDPDETPEPQETVVEEKEATDAVDLKFSSPNRYTFQYTGPLANGAPQGNGMGFYPEGVYKGNYDKGVRSGHGTFKTSDGANKFVGDWTNDDYSKGKLTFLNDNSYYVGTFVNHAPQDGDYYTSAGELKYKVVGGNWIEQ